MHHRLIFMTTLITLIAIVMVFIAVVETIQAAYRHLEALNMRYHVSYFQNGELLQQDHLSFRPAQAHLVINAVRRGADFVELKDNGQPRVRRRVKRTENGWEAKNVVVS